MTQLYTRRPVSVWRKLALAALVATAASSTSALAQSLNYTVSGATNVAGTYTDLGTNGTAITTADLDNANSTAQPIGFTFNYNGQAFTQFILNTNGWMKLGSTAPSNALGTYEYVSDVFSTSNAADQNIIAALGADLIGTAAAGSEYRVATTGTAPNRVCTIQWKNIADKSLTLTSGAVPAQYSNVNFQVKLYETTNVVELVYGTFTPASTGAVAARGANAGLKGNNSTNNQVLLVEKAATAAWSATNFQSTLYNFPAQGLYFNRTVAPDAGRTIRFTPGQAVANDSEVQLIYTLTKLPRTAAAPHTVQAVIRNTGVNALSGLAVRLSVSGANTYTNSKSITSLPVGGSVTVAFDPYTPANLGTNAVRVELVLADDDASNNTKTVSQEVTDNVFSYATTGPVGSVLGIPAGANGAANVGAFLVKYTTGATRNVTGANIRLESSSTVSSVGRTVYAVVMNSAGSVLGRTTDYVIQQSDLGTSKSFVFPTPVAVTAGDFYVGLAQVNPAGSVQFYALALQDEEPTRPGVFYAALPLNATGANQLQDLASEDFGIFMIDAVLNTTTGVSKALESAVSVYPNPSNGEISLTVRGAKAPNGLLVEVTNLLGQRVYAGTAKDNFENKLNLSHLSKGLYTLKVKDGDQYMMRTISITK